MITDPSLVVAQFAYPMGVTGLTDVMKGLAKVYRDKDLVIVTDGPLWRPGWMVVAHRQPVDVVGDLLAEAEADAEAAAS